MVDLNFLEAIDRNQIQDLVQHSRMGKLFEYFEQRRGTTPHIGEIETTNACTFRCVMCPRGRGHMTRPIGNMAQALFCDIIGQLKQYQPIYAKQSSRFRAPKASPWEVFEACGLRLHHFGDPLLDPLIADRVQYVKETSILKVHFSTSPLHLDHNISNRLLEAGIDRICFALDATNESEYIDIRGVDVVGGYNTAISNIKEFLRIRERSRAATSVQVQFVPLRPNERSLDTFNEYWRNEGVDVVVKNFASYPEVPITVARTRAECNTSPTLATKVCKRPYYSMNVLCDGRIVPCSFDYNGENIVGDLRTERVAEVWNGTKFRDFRSQFVTNTLPPSSLCHRCGQYIWRRE